jgi:hypothetical protein
MIFDIAGHVRLHLRSEDPDALRAVQRLMDPYGAMDASTKAAPPVVELRELRGEQAASEVQLAAVDALVTASDAERLYLVLGGRRASVPDALVDEPASVAFTRGFPMGPMYRQIVRPAMQLAALRGGGLAVHASAVVREGGAILVAGWSESGKTELALALAERGASFLSDKWTLLGGDDAGATAAAFPITVGVRRWLLRYAPRLRDALPGRSRARFAAAATWGAITSPIRSLRGGGAAGVLSSGATRALTLADRAALAPSELAAVYGHEPMTQRVPVSMLVVLRTVPDGDVVVREAGLPGVAERLAASAVTERQVYWALRQRAAFALGTPSRQAEVAAIEAERMVELLGSVPVVEVSAPFPTDPQRVVASLAPWLPSTG